MNSVCDVAQHLAMATDVLRRPMDNIYGAQCAEVTHYRPDLSQVSVCSRLDGIGLVGILYRRFIRQLTLIFGGHRQCEA